VPVILSAAVLRKFAVEDEAIARVTVDSIVSNVRLGNPVFPSSFDATGHGDDHCVHELCRVEGLQEETGSMVRGC